MIVGAAGLGVTAKQTVEAKLYAEHTELVVEEELPLQLILQPLDGRPEGILDELNSLVLDIAEGRVGELRDHVRRDVDDAADVLDGKGFRLDESRGDRIDGELLVLDAVLQERGVEVAGTQLEVLHEGLVLLVAQVAFRLQDRLQIAATLVELGSELLSSEGLAERERVVDDRVHALDAVKGDEHEVEHVLVRPDPGEPGPVGVGALDLVPLVLPLHEGDTGDPGRVDLMEGDRGAGAVALDVCVGVAPPVQPGVDHVPEVELVRVGVRPDVDDTEGGMVGRIDEAFRRALLDVLGEGCDILGPDADAGIQGGNLERGLVVDGYAERGGRPNNAVGGHRYGSITST